MIQNRIRLGELLVRAGVLAESQLRAALQEQRQHGGKLGDILVRMQLLGEDVFVRALAKQLGLPRANLTRPIALEALARVPAGLAERCELVPLTLSDDGDTLTIATSDPLDAQMLDEVRLIAGVQTVLPHVAGTTDIRAAIARLYRGPAAPPAYPAVSDAPATPGFRPSPGFFPPAPPVLAPGSFAPPLQSPVDARLAALEGLQLRDEGALRAILALLIEKGVFSLDEYLAKVRR